MSALSPAFAEAQALLQAAANYRRRHHMSETATLSLFLPSWFVEFIKVDMVNDHSMGLGDRLTAVRGAAWKALLRNMARTPSPASSTSSCGRTARVGG